MLILPLLILLPNFEFLSSQPNDICQITLLIFTKCLNPITFKKKNFLNVKKKKLKLNNITFLIKKHLQRENILLPFFQNFVKKGLTTFL